MQDASCLMMKKMYVGGWDSSDIWALLNPIPNHFLIIANHYSILNHINQN